MAEPAERRSPDKQEAAEHRPERKPYTAPTLIEYGSLAALTQGFGSRQHDHKTGKMNASGS